MEAEAYPQDYLFVTHVFDVVKFGLNPTSNRSFAKRPILVTVQAVLVTTARIFRSRVRLKSQARF
jgi:hypothetical protein